MKTLKLDHGLAQLVRRGEKTSTWRMYDDKDLSVNDEVRLVDKVNPVRPETWQHFGIARIEQVYEKQLGDISKDEMLAHGYVSTGAMLAEFQKYYGSDVTLTSTIKVIYFIFHAH